MAWLMSNVCDAEWSITPNGKAVNVSVVSARRTAGSNCVVRTQYTKGTAGNADLDVYVHSIASYETNANNTGFTGTVIANILTLTDASPIQTHDTPTPAALGGRTVCYVGEYASGVSGFNSEIGALHGFTASNLQEVAQWAGYRDVVWSTGVIFTVVDDYSIGSDEYLLRGEVTSGGVVEGPASHLSVSNTCESPVVYVKGYSNTYNSTGPYPYPDEDEAGDYAGVGTLPVIVEFEVKDSSLDWTLVSYDATDLNSQTVQLNAFPITVKNGDFFASTWQQNTTITFTAGVPNATSGSWVFGTGGLSVGNIGAFVVGVRRTTIDINSVGHLALKYPPTNKETGLQTYYYHTAWVKHADATFDPASTMFNTDIVDSGAVSTLVTRYMHADSSSGNLKFDGAIRREWANATASTTLGSAPAVPYNSISGAVELADGSRAVITPFSLTAQYEADTPDAITISDGSPTSGNPIVKARLFYKDLSPTGALGGTAADIITGNFAPPAGWYEVAGFNVAAGTAGVTDDPDSPSGVIIDDIPRGTNDDLPGYGGGYTIEFPDYDPQLPDTPRVPIIRDPNDTDVTPPGAQPLPRGLGPNPTIRYIFVGRMLWVMYGGDVLVTYIIPSATWDGLPTASKEYVGYYNSAEEEVSTPADVVTAPALASPGFTFSWGSYRTNLGSEPKLWEYAQIEATKDFLVTGGTVTVTELPTDAQITAATKVVLGGRDRDAQSTLTYDEAIQVADAHGANLLYPMQVS